MFLEGGSCYVKRRAYFFSISNFYNDHTLPEKSERDISIWETLKYEKKKRKKHWKP